MAEDKPEQPPPCTPTRSPPCSEDTPSLASRARIFFAARSETLIFGTAGDAVSVAINAARTSKSFVCRAHSNCAIALTPGTAKSGCATEEPESLVRGLLGSGHGDAVLVLPIADRGLDGVFRQHRTVNLDRGQRQFANDVGVLDRQRFFHGLALHPFGGQRRTGNRGAAAKGLEAGFLDDLSLRIDAHLQFHHVAAFRSADQAGADVGIFLGKASDVAGVVVMVYNFFAISHKSFSSAAPNPFRLIAAAKTKITCSAPDCRCHATHPYSY